MATITAPADPIGVIQPAGVLAAHWTFDETTGTVVADDFGNEMIAVSRVTMLRPEDGWSGGAVAFQNLEDVLLIPENRRLNTLLQAPFLQRTVAMWINVEDVSATQTLYEEGDDHDGLALRLQNGILQARVITTIDGETLAAQAAHPFSTIGEWQHVAAVFNSGVLVLYLNGEPVDFVDDIPFAVVPAHSTPTALGATAGRNAFNDDTGATTFRGLMDDVYIFATEYIEPPPAASATVTTITPSLIVTAVATPTLTPSITSTPTPTPPPPASATSPATATKPPETVTPAATQTPLPVVTAQATTAITSAATAAAGVPAAIQGLPLLDLPFPYDGGNESFGGSPSQFRQSCQSAQNDGRVTSFYDHLYPLYPSEQAGNVTNGREPFDSPYGGRVLPFDGILRDSDYSGHPGYDFSPYEVRQATTPLFAAADGIVHNVAIHAASGAHYIEILHRTVGFGDYLTRYWHLEPDEYFKAMRTRVGLPIAAGERIGTIGNTGWSTGHHLHFEVRFDRNSDGEFSLDESVDPFGFVPSGAYPEDPWQTEIAFVDGKGNTYHHTGSQSRYLWKYPLGTTAMMPSDGGGRLTQYGGVGGEGGSELCAPNGSIPPGSVINWSWIADPPPSMGLVGTGNGCLLSVVGPDNSSVERFTPPIQIAVPFAAGDLVNVADPAQTLAIYWQRPGSEAYERLDTIVDLDAGMAYASTEYPGLCALLGLPNRDLVAPKTSIVVDGPTAGDGIFTGPVTVSLSSADNDVTYIEYSIDGGNTWRLYESPFVIPGDAQSMGVPDPLPDEEGAAGLIRGPGRYLVLAAGHDIAGNSEYPPAEQLIYIEPIIPTTEPAPPTVPPPTPTVPPPISSPTPVPDSNSLPEPNPTPAPIATPAPVPTPEPIPTPGGIPTPSP